MLPPTSALFDTAHDEPRSRLCHCAQEQLFTGFLVSPRTFRDDTVTYIDKGLTVNDEIAVKEVRQRLPPSDPADLLISETVSGKSFDVLEAYPRHG